MAEIMTIIHTKVLPEMFKRVGLESEDIRTYVKEPQWFLKASWTLAEQSDFQSWLVQLLKKEMKYSLYRAEKEVAMFILGYGWTIKD